MYIPLMSRVGFVALDKCHSSLLYHISTNQLVHIAVQIQHSTLERDGGVGH